MIPIAKVLADRGHNVTILVFDTQGDVVYYPGINDITLVLTTAQVFAQRTPQSWTYYFPPLVGWMDNMCKAAVSSNRSVFEQLTTETFDLVLIEGKFIISSQLIGSLTGGNFAYFIAFLPANGRHNAAGIPLIPSVSPRLDYLTCDVTNSFISRLLRVSIFYYGLDMVISAIFYQHERDAKWLLKTIWKDKERKPLKKTIINILLSTSPAAIEFTMPINHNVFESQLNCETPDGTLSSELLKFTEVPSKGLIVVSSGHLGRWSPTAYAKFLSIFQSLSDCRIVWGKNFEGPATFNNSHIFVASWLPITLLLNRPDTKLFVTHGGAKSVAESICANVPMLLHPDVLHDQFGNSKFMEKIGLGIAVIGDRFGKDKVVQSIQKLLTNGSYKDRVSHYRSMAIDRPIDFKNQTGKMLEKIMRRGDSLSYFSDRGQHLYTWTFLCLDGFICYIAFMLLLQWQLFWNDTANGREYIFRYQLIPIDNDCRLSASDQE